MEEDPFEGQPHLQTQYYNAFTACITDAINSAKQNGTLPVQHEQTLRERLEAYRDRPAQSEPFKRLFKNETLENFKSQLSVWINQSAITYFSELQQTEAVDADASAATQAAVQKAEEEEFHIRVSVQAAEKERYLASRRWGAPPPPPGGPLRMRLPDADALAVPSRRWVPPDFRRAFTSDPLPLDELLDPPNSVGAGCIHCLERTGSVAPHHSSSTCPARKKPACPECGKEGHYKVQKELCTAQRRICYRCSKLGHEPDDCPAPTFGASPTDEIERSNAIAVAAAAAAATAGAAARGGAAVPWRKAREGAVEGGAVGGAMAEGGGYGYGTATGEGGYGYGTAGAAAAAGGGAVATAAAPFDESLYGYGAGQAGGAVTVGGAAPPGAAGGAVAAATGAGGAYDAYGYGAYGYGTGAYGYGTDYGAYASAYGAPAAPGGGYDAAAAAPPPGGAPGGEGTGAAAAAAAYAQGGAYSGYSAQHAGQGPPIGYTTGAYGYGGYDASGAGGYDGAPPPAPPAPEAQG